MWGLGFFKGLAVTMRNMLRGPITLQYPEVREQLPERARWALQHKCDAEGRPKCTACEICVRTCPDGIIMLDYHKAEDGTKHIDAYVYEVGACMFCGLCVESCPFDAIEMGEDYELATYDPSGFYRTLLEDVDAAGPKRTAAAEAKPVAEAPEPGASSAQTGFAGETVSAQTPSAPPAPTSPAAELAADAPGSGASATDTSSGGEPDA
jgi:NADH-quinone oxidoreductase subunit I